MQMNSTNASLEAVGKRFEVWPELIWVDYVGFVSQLVFLALGPPLNSFIVWILHQERQLSLFDLAQWNGAIFDSIQARNRYFIEYQVHCERGTIQTSRSASE